MPVIINRKTAQQIVDTVKDVCGQNINFINERGYIIASTDASRINTFHELGREVLLSKTTLEVTDDDSYYGTQKGVNIPIVYNGTAIAVVGISGEPDQVRQYARLAQKITHLILRERELDQQSNDRKSRMNYVIHSLTSQSDMNQQYLKDFLAENHVDMNQKFYTLILRLDPRYNASNLFLIEQQVFHVFDQAGSPLYTFNYPNEYILIMNEAQRKNSWFLFEELAREQGQILKVALGQLQPLTKQYLSYRAAELAFQSLGEEESLAVYDELDLELLLGSVPEDVRDSFLQKTVRGLEEENLKILRVYFEEDRSLVRASERLHMHKNTLQYQLDRIYRICGYNPRRFHDAAVLYNALKLKGKCSG